MIIFIFEWIIILFYLGIEKKIIFSIENINKIMCFKFKIYYERYLYNYVVIYVYFFIIIYRSKYKMFFLLM